MGKQRRGSKRIGRQAKRHRRLLKVTAVPNTFTSSLLKVHHDHTYATIEDVCKLCGFVGEFTNCSCIVHEAEPLPLERTDSAEDLEADEYFIVWDKSVCQYTEEDDVDLFNLQFLRGDVIRKENELNELDFNVVRTSDTLQLVQFYKRGALFVKLSLTVNSELEPMVHVHGRLLPSTHPVYLQKTEVLSFQSVCNLLQSINNYTICSGNDDNNYISNFGHKGNAYMESDCGAAYKATIRSRTCTLLTMSIPRCHECGYCRRILRKKEKRLKNQVVIEQTNEDVLHSSKPNSSMSKPELVRKTNLLKGRTRDLKSENKRLRVKIELESERHVKLNESDAEDMEKLVNDCSSQVEEIWPDANSFQRIFWEEQVKYNSLKSKYAMRWHPLIVKWALLVKSKSSKAYKAMRDHGFINLPSERTLFDYSHCIPSKLGFQAEVVDMLVKECTAKGMYNEEWKGYVGLLQDEIKVKDDLVYCPTTGQLIGYVYLDDTGNQLLELEEGRNSTEKQLATSALVIMVRGTSTNLKFPLAAFSTRNLDAKQLYTILWRAVEIIEMDAGLKVLFITCDGAAQNRKFFEMNKSSPIQEPVNCCLNPYACDGRILYFISDVPHLLKTTRNCFANSGSHRKSRILWNNGQDILWTHIVRLYEEHVEKNLYTKVPLNRSHVDLTSFSQMKVALAAQVLSNRVAAVLEQEYGDKVKETATFIRHMNRFFDCLNTRNLHEGKNKRNPDLDAYTDSSDPRLHYLEETFLGYFDSWHHSVESRRGNSSSKQRVQMQLSKQTLNGLKISVRSIVACVRYLLEQGTPFVLTEIFNQDIIEQHFGHYRHKGGANDNPTIDNVRHTINSLRVIGSTALAPLNGNTKRGKERLQPDCTPLPRKKSRPSSAF